MAHLVKQLLDPVGIFWIFLIIISALHLYKRQNRWAIVHGFMILFLFLAGGTPLPQWLLKDLESPYYETLFDPGKKYDAIIVLGGYASKDSKGITGINAGGAFDRILTGVELARKESGDHLLIGIGNVPDSRIKEWIERWDLTDIPIENLPSCSNTYQESQAVKKLADENSWEKVLLVTSAWHMPRAQAVFISSGVNVVPVPCDFHSTGDFYINIIPQSGQLSNMQLFLQEKIGYMYYRLKGWIQPITPTVSDK